ncbi:regucalcin-like [Uloborus diversus]|uniref:regucalcin-like n=1 Tax=Uloborus diversus TaxID=327109 RepID=UPI0024097FAF|nr:regucalcin-like [Uloborus diversus]
MSVSAVSKTCFDLGEGPHWDARHQKLYFVDAFVGDVCRLDTKTGSAEKVHFDGIVSFVIPYQDNDSDVILSVTKQVRKLNFKTGQSELLTTVAPETRERFNDAKCDARGRLWAGTLVEGEKMKGYLYKLDSSNNFQPIVDKITLTNGLTWSLDNQTLYYIDSGEKKIFVFDFNLEEGTTSNQRVLFDYNTDEGFENLGVPDGMTIDIEGKLWVCNYGGSCVLRLDPQTRSILQRVEMPAKNVTSCCFGGPHYDILYVTTASAGLTEEEKERHPKAGSVFAVTGLGTRGQPLNNFVA